MWSGKYGEDPSVKEALFHATLGKMVLEYVKNEESAVIQPEMEHHAFQVLEEVWRILQDPALDDPGCIQKIESILSVFYRELELRSVRHIEYD